LISPPSSSLALFASIAELTVGQIIAYYLRSCVDLACFWFTTNESTVRIYFFVQALMSGALLPLWFFPSWFNTISSWLPFELLYNNPLSVYVGRISTASTPRDLVVATCWAVILGGITRLLWQAAGRRVSMQGG
jgi:ABC-2 type transport system permease protein